MDEELKRKGCYFLFDLYLVIKGTYSLTQDLKSVYEVRKGKGVARVKLALWYNNVEGTDLEIL